LFRSKLSEVSPAPVSIDENLNIQSKNSLEMMFCTRPLGYQPIYSSTITISKTVKDFLYDEGDFEEKGRLHFDNSASSGTEYLHGKESLSHDKAYNFSDTDDSNSINARRYKKSVVEEQSTESRIKPKNFESELSNPHEYHGVPERMQSDLWAKRNVQEEFMPALLDLEMPGNHQYDSETSKHSQPISYLLHSPGGTSAKNATASESWLGIQNAKFLPNSMVSNQPMFDTANQNDKAKPRLAEDYEKISHSKTESLSYPGDAAFLMHVDGGSKQDLLTVPKGDCAECHSAVSGQVLLTMGNIYHPQHFTCAHCRCELGTDIFFEHNGQPFCERDYQMLFAPKCGLCNDAIMEKCITAANRSFHPDHFVCAACGQQFGDSGFHEKDGQTYCSDDYFAMFAPRCRNCEQPILCNYISALHCQWHPECFVCQECRCPFESGTFYEHEGLPFCEKHFYSRSGSVCATCTQPIAGRCIAAMYKKFHPEHFSCSFCLQALNKGTFKEQNNKLYCHACFDKLFG
jgi:hypothetical protein